MLKRQAVTPYLYILHTISKKSSVIAENSKNRPCFGDRIAAYTGDARDIIQRIDEQFDLVFIDADKENYSLYYDLVFPKITTGGYIIADNVLWSGNVLKADAEMDEETKAISLFNKKVQSDSRVENVLLPVRDGLMVIRKTCD